jgi:hypothetical protein
MVTLTARFKLISKGIYIVYNVMVGLLGPAEPAHAPEQFCNAWTIMVIQSGYEAGVT